MTNESKHAAFADTGRAGEESRGHKGEHKPSAQYMMEASKLSGKGMAKTALEYRKLAKGRGKLTLEDYVKFSVMMADEEEQSRFISETQHWAIVGQMSNMLYHGATEDKWLATFLMQTAGIPVPDILAVIDTTEREVLKFPKLSNADELAAFLGTAEFPLFGKPNLGQGSFGAFVIESWDGSNITLHGGEQWAIGDFMDKWLAGNSFLLQSKLQNHPEMAPLSGHLITCRILIFNDDDRIFFPWTCMKIPGGNNFADNFWRDENLIADLDRETGTMKTLRKMQDGHIVDCDADTLGGVLGKGFTVPHWDEAAELARRCSKLFHWAKYSSVDVAITPDGPVIIEANTGGSFALHQYASGRGFLTDEVIAFFRKYGVGV